MILSMISLFGSRRKWPRLLGDKKTKVNNMHLWMEMQAWG
jgi:hypothetical protein